MSETKSEARANLLIWILIVDLGSQYTKVIARTLAELGFRSVILPPKEASDWLKNNTPKAIILSGGSAGVNDKDFVAPPAGVLDANVPVLGICLGMQWLAKYFDGVIISMMGNKEYGETRIILDTANPLFAGMEKEQIVWASHGDSVQVIPRGFREIARSKDGETIEAIWNPARNIFALQFHPEVVHTPHGKEILKKFLADISGCEKDWQPRNIIEEIRAEICGAIKSGERAIIGFSGGVDSTTLSAIAAKVLKEDLLAVCIDTGALREDELEEIKFNAQAAGVRLKIVKAARIFQKYLGNTTDAEKKRKRFKKAYAKILGREAKSFGAKYLLQGTLNTDIIESGKDGEAAGIKGHHNVDNLIPGVEQLHPLRNLFKYEVRLLTKELGLPDSIVERKPFPGPGLFIRVSGEPAKPDKLAIVRWADGEVDYIVRKNAGVYNEISQLIVALNCVKTVGIKGDSRSYAYAIAVRALVTTDFMTGKGYQFPPEMRREITTALTRHPKIVRVFFDETNKPPATTEME